jgi:hypothetical protein
VNIGPLFVALLLNQNLGQHNQFEAVALSEHSTYQSPALKTKWITMTRAKRQLKI